MRAELSRRISDFGLRSSLFRSPPSIEWRGGECEVLLHSRLLCGRAVFPLCTRAGEWLSDAVVGTLLNAGCILAGGIAGLVMKKPLSAANQLFFKLVLGLGVIVAGLRLAWMSIASESETFVEVFQRLGLVILALMLGRFTGAMLRIQKASNRVGRFAREKMSGVRPDNANRFSDGFSVAAALFCAAPLAVFGSVADGFAGYFWPLVIKGVMDGMAVMGFVGMFGAGVILSAVPVFVFQGTITLFCSRILLPWFEQSGWTDAASAMNATAGLLIFTVSLIVFEVKKIEVSDYLPSLVFAPVLWCWLL